MIIPGETMNTEVTYENWENKAIITITRLEAHNALTQDGWKLLGDFFQEAENDTDVLVVIMTGAGEKDFCSGADLKKTIPQLLGEKG
jgi:enoyl-CoA hydratase/carnithine racemase